MEKVKQKILTPTINKSYVKTDYYFCLKHMISEFILITFRYQILIAGSNGWDNYRHQSDVMALSSLLHTDEENIITTFMTDDLVDSMKNPFPGQLFNTLSTNSEFNIYNKSYINSSIITLDSIKQMMSRFNFTTNDIITIYYNDHGAPGMLCTPKTKYRCNSDFFADDIQKYLLELSRTGAKILFIIESCYSGSVAKYISIPNVLTIAAANSVQSSYAAKYSPTLQTFVSNLFTLNLIDYLNDVSNRDSTILDMTNYLSKYTLRSTVGLYGDKRYSDLFTKYKIKDVFGDLGTIPRDDEYDNEQKLMKINDEAKRTQNIKLFNLMNIVSFNPWLVRLYHQEIEKRIHHQTMFKYILGNVSDSLRLLGMFSNDEQTFVENIFKPLMYDNDFSSESVNSKFSFLPEEIIFQDYTCLKETLNTYKRYCGTFGDAEYDQFLPSLARICFHYPQRPDIISLNIRRVCQSDVYKFH